MSFRKRENTSVGETTNIELAPYLVTGNGYEVKLQSEPLTKKCPIMDPIRQVSRPGGRQV